MKIPQRVSVHLADKYPIFKKDGNKLVPLPTKNVGRRYSLITNVQTGETYYLEFTDQEEAQADLQKVEWEAGAPEREAEAKRLADEAQKFEEALQYKNRVVAFLDILGWKQAILSKGCDVVKILGKTLAQLQGVVSQVNSLRNLCPEDKKWPGDPVMTQFSDCLVLSVENDSYGRETLQNTLYILTSNLIQFGFLLRGGVTRGQIFHDRGLVYGRALIDAYELESKVASFPRVILSKELSTEWGGQEKTGGFPWIHGDDDHLYYNFLPPFTGNPFYNDQQLWQNRLTPIRELILRKAGDSGCPESVYSKYRWLASYYDRVCDEHPEIELERVAHLATLIRLGKRNGDG